MEEVRSMLRQKLDTKKLIFNISLALLSLIVFFAIYLLVTGRLTLGAYNKTWDGYGFKLENLVEVEPIYINGKLSLWDYEGEIHEKVSKSGN